MLKTVIKKLESEMIIDGNGDAWGERIPSTKEIIGKVNEIIDVVNKISQDRHE